MTRLEELESRLVPAPVFSPHLVPLHGFAPNLVTTPQMIRHAYGFDLLPYDGSGQTIAVIEAFHDPYIDGDLAAFDAAYGLPAPDLVKVSQIGPAGQLPTQHDPLWGAETSLDVEWVHAIAPGARILLIEADDNLSGLFAAMAEAARYPGVTAVTMSFGAHMNGGDLLNDDIFQTLPGHAPVTWFASTGDAGDQDLDVQYPASSPNVVAVGGTTLLMDSAGDVASETAWYLGGAGRSYDEPLPEYQAGVVPSATRSIPDVSYDADPATGFSVYSTDYGGWRQFGGTSAGAPQWAALCALASQARGASFDGRSEFLPAVYQLHGLGFADVTQGVNGRWSAGPGWDFATGWGSPRADVLIPELAGNANSGQPLSVQGWYTDGTLYTTVVGSGMHLRMIQFDGGIVGLYLVNADGSTGACLSGAANVTSVRLNIVGTGNTLDAQMFSSEQLPAVFGSYFGGTLSVTMAGVPRFKVIEFPDIDNIAGLYPVLGDGSLGQPLSGHDGVTDLSLTISL